MIKKVGFFIILLFAVIAMCLPMLVIIVEFLNIEVARLFFYPLKLPRPEVISNVISDSYLYENSLNKIMTIIVGLGLFCLSFKIAPKSVISKGELECSSGNFKESIFRRKVKKYSSAQATFELGTIKNKTTKTLGLGLSTSSMPDGLLGFTKEQFVCELSKRATIEAVKSFAELNPQFVTVQLVDIEYI